MRAGTGAPSHNARTERTVRADIAAASQDAQSRHDYQRDQLHDGHDSVREGRAARAGIVAASQHAPFASQHGQAAVRGRREVGFSRAEASTGAASADARSRDDDQLRFDDLSMRGSREVSACICLRVSLDET